jgi:hypothetical protein
LREEDSLAEPVAVLAVKERELPAAAVEFVAEAIGTVSGSGAEVARPELLVDEVARDAPEGVAPAAKERAKRRVAAGRRVEASAAATEARATLRHNAAEDLKEKASGTAEEEEAAGDQGGEGEGCRRGPWSGGNSWCGRDAFYGSRLDSDPRCGGQAVAGA